MLLVGACLGRLVVLASVHIVAARGHESSGRAPDCTLLPADVLTFFKRCCMHHCCLALRAVRQPQKAQCSLDWASFSVFAASCVLAAVSLVLPSTLAPTHP